MPTSRLSSKSQITLPKEVRERAGLAPGDYVTYELRDDTIVLRKVDPFDAAFHRALEGALEEWASPQDDEVFGDL
jgi:AbrB family looped-hinge helix DNA binding protein